MMGGDHNKGDPTTKKQPQKSPRQSTSPKEPLEEPTGKETRHKQQPPPPLVVVTGGPLPPPLYLPILGGTSTTTATTASTPPVFEQVQFELPINPKRARFGSAATSSPQWKLLASPSHSRQHKLSQLAPGDESSPSPTTNPQLAAASQLQPHHQTTAAASSSDTASSPPPPHSPMPSQETTRPEGDQNQNPPPHHHHPQFRKGKYVSPVWKPYEMLWLAKAWRVQHQGGGGGSSEPFPVETSGGEVQIVQSTRGKSRADKDKEVAEFLKRHGVNRDAKTAGTKWDNMLGEFRKVYEWERGGEREQVGKSYFRLSPYERKIHRLPASFDEEVFEELAQFMGSRIRNPQGRVGAVGTSLAIGSGDEGRSSSGGLAGVRALPLPPPPPFKEDDPIAISGRTRQLVIPSTMGGEAYFHGGGSGRGSLLGFESPMDANVGGGGGVSSSSSTSKELRRIGKIRMTWEESVSLWAEEGEHNRGRVRLQGCSSFLNADELIFFDDSMVACPIEAFEDGPLKGFSVDKFVSGQHVKVFGRRKSSSSPAAAPSTAPSGFIERIQLPLPEPSIRPMPPWEYQDPTEYYVGCLRVPPAAVPSLLELSWYIKEPPQEELRFPLRKDVYRDLPLGKELFFTTSTELLDCRGITFDILSSIIRPNPSISSSTASSRDSFIGLWDDCINRIVSKFCSVEVVMVRKPPNSSLADSYQDQWPNVTGFVRNFCLWRGEETDQVREGQPEPSASLADKLLWTYTDLPYILGYYAIGYTVTFCALSRSQDRVIRTDLYSLDLSSSVERLRALVPCYRVASLLPLLADRCFNNSSGNGTNFGKLQVITFSDFERVDMGNGNIMEMTPNAVTKFFSSKRRWAAVKEIHELFDRRIPHAEFICQSSEKDLALVFKPRGVKFKPNNCDQLVEALKCVTKALVALHDLGFMHRDLSWDKVVMRRADREAAETEWFVCEFDEAAGAPQLYPHVSGEARGRHAPEMGRGLHGVKVDVWGVGHLIKTCGLGPSGVPKMLRELQNRCLDLNPEQRPTAADCYHHLLQVQSSLQSSSSGAAPY